ncbi:MAG TPA: P1 family peptidase, partial [Acidimicrobiales bacterium]|jgi:L-aminopeptidase/D-esterase-like protein|nr:P1 family peptidase [Acidimicrobiales bacterium]
MRFCEERGLGVPTPGGAVPIVVGFGLFDLAVGDPTVRPGPEHGYTACEAATAGPVALGRVGAGTGATVGLPPAPPPPGTASDRPSGVAASGMAGATGPGHHSSGVDAAAATGASRPGHLPGSGAAASGGGDAPLGRGPGGVVSATVRSGELVVSSLVVVNAFGVVDGDDAGASDLVAALAVDGVWPAPFGNTTIGLVATNATLDKVGCHLLAQSAHDGLARAVFPAHTRLDGDAFVAAAVGGVTADVDAVRTLGVHAVAEAIRTVGRVL